jgi:hypothetical protein
MFCNNIIIYIYSFIYPQKISNLIKLKNKYNFLNGIIEYNDFIQSLNIITYKNLYKYIMVYYNLNNIIKINILYDYPIFIKNIKKKEYVFLKHYQKLRNINITLLTWHWHKCLKIILENNNYTKCYNIIINHSTKMKLLDELYAR